MAEVYCHRRLALEDLYREKGIDASTNKLAIVKAIVFGVAESYLRAAIEAETISTIITPDQLRRILNTVARHFFPKHAVELQTLWFRQH